MKTAYINPKKCDKSPFCPVKRVCPVGAITQTGGLFGGGMPTVDKAKCTGCGKCLRVCPHGAVTMV